MRPPAPERVPRPGARGWWTRGLGDRAPGPLCGRLGPGGAAFIQLYGIVGILGALLVAAASGLLLGVSALVVWVRGRRGGLARALVPGSLVAFASSGAVALDAALEVHALPALFGAPSWDENRWYDGWGLGLVAAGVAGGLVTSAVVRRRARAGP